MTNVSLAQYDFTRNAGAKKFVTVVATFYSGCTPGREDYPTFTKYVSELHSRTTNGFLPGNVAFLASLKNGVNAGVAEAWARIDGSDVTDGTSNGGFPYLVDDRHRALVYKFFDPAVHPAYAVVDHCMRYHALLPAVSAQTGNNTLVKVVEALLKNTSEACPTDDAMPPAAEIRPKRQPPLAFVPSELSSEAACVPAFGTSRSVKKLETGVPTAFAQPRALGFHPTSGNLWVGNNNTDSLTILRGVFNRSEGAAGAPTTSGLAHRFDRAHYHYMDRMASLAFGAGSSLVTCQESENTYDGKKTANRFMGPSLYDTIATVGSPEMGGWPKGRHIYIDAAGNACDPHVAADASSDGSNDAPTCFMTHIDMLHASPNCMGIAHDPEPTTPFNNVFWVFDGLNNTLIRYDFEKPHGPGSLDHSLANVRRYPEINLTRVPGVPGHMVVDAQTRTLFIADTGGGRIVAVDADSGRFINHARSDLGGNFTLWSSPLSSFEYSMFGCARHKTFATGLDRPSGLALHGNTLLVAEHGTGKIVALHRSTGARLGELATGASKLFGLAVEPVTGVLWFVDGADNSAVGYVKRDQTCEAAGKAAVPNGPAIEFPTSSSSETGREYCIPEVVSLGTAVKGITHDDGYLNMTPLGPGYGVTPECSACAAGCDNDMLLMSGFLCHKCLPDNCRDGGIYPASKGTCTNIIGKGYKCTCDDGAYGDHCQYRVKGVASVSPPPPVVASAGDLGAPPDWLPYLLAVAVVVGMHDALAIL